MTAKKRSSLFFHAVLSGALLLSVTLFVFAPVDFFSGNQRNFAFVLMDFLPCLLLVASGTIAVSAGVGLLLKGKARLIFAGLLASAGILFYAQGNFLNADYGLMDGRPIDWPQFATYGIINTVIWIVVIAAVLLLCVFKSNMMGKVIKWGCFYLVLVELLSIGTELILGNPNAGSNATAVAQEEEYICSTDDLFTYSKDKNIVLYVADTYNYELLSLQLQQNPELFVDWDGFVLYTDYISGYPKTVGAVPNLMSDTFYYNNYPYTDWIYGEHNTVSWMRELHNAGYKVNIYPDLGYMTNAANAEYIDNIIDSHLVVDSAWGLARDYWGIVMFRYMPHYAKSSFEGTAFNANKHSVSSTKGVELYVAENANFLTYLQNAQLKTTTKPVFKYIHNGGAHFPYNFNADMETVEDNSITIIEQGKGVVAMFNLYLDFLRQNDLYDQTTIILTGDHGMHLDITSHPPLLIKPANAHGALRFDDTPVYAGQMGASVLDIAGLPRDNYSSSFFDPVDKNLVRKFLFYAGDLGKTLPDLYEYDVYPGPTFVSTGNVYLRDTGKPVPADSQPEPYQLGVNMKQANYAQYVQCGIAEDKWTTSASSHLHIPLAEAPDHDLTVTISTYTGKENLRFCIYSNGVFLSAEQCSPDPATYSFTLPRDLLMDNAANIELRFDNLFEIAPSTNDARRLGMLITDIMLE